MTPAEVDARVAQLRQRLAAQAGAPSLEAFLKSNSTTMDDLRDNLRVRLEAEKLAQKGQPTVHRAHIHYIVVLTTNPGGDPTKKPHTDAEAKAIIAKAQADLKASRPLRPSPPSTPRTAARAPAGTSASSARTARSTPPSSRRRWRSSRAR